MRALTIILCLCLAGCGSFPLGTSYPQKGQTQQQLHIDILICKDQAKTEDETSARLAGAFLAGLTIVGTPFVITNSRDKQRAVFAQCMTEKGYRVEQPA